MMKRLRENQVLFEKRQLFGIRKLKLGVASVAIATAFSLGTASGQTIAAAESLTGVEPTDGAVMVKSEAADQGSKELPEATDISDIASISDVTKVSAAVNADTVKEVQPVAVPLVEDQAQAEATDQSQPSSSIVPVTTDSSLETPEATSSEE
ncbi:YSIRK-type signal peptide-containing protein, partial [Streptococcus equi]